MQGKHEYQPELFSQIDYEHLIPKGHLLRKIDRVLDLSFLPALTKPLYAERMGRPSIDPIVFVRMTLLGYLYNVDSDRQLCEEVGYNLAYRWFCRLSLKDGVPIILRLPKFVIDWARVRMQKFSAAFLSNAAKLGS